MNNTGYRFNPLSGRSYTKELQVIELTTWSLICFNPLSGRSYTKGVACFDNVEAKGLSGFNPLSGRSYTKETKVTTLLLLHFQLKFQSPVGA